MSPDPQEGASTECEGAAKQLRRSCEGAEGVSQDGEASSANCEGAADAVTDAVTDVVKDAVTCCIQAYIYAAYMQHVQCVTGVTGMAWRDDVTHNA